MSDPSTRPVAQAQAPPSARDRRPSPPLPDVSFPMLLEAAPDALVIVGSDGKIALMNSQLLRMFGYERDQLVGMPIEVLVPERFRPAHAKDRLAFFGEPRARPMGAGIDLRARRKDGTEFPVEISLSPMPTRAGTLVIAAVRDITERKHVEMRLRSSLKEKEVLLKEIHHRVKNNLQIVSSMLNLQMKQISEPRAIDLFKETQNRVRSIALFHEKLYQSRDLARLDVRGYLEGVARGLASAYGALPDQLGVTIDAEEVQLGIDAAIATGLIVNELLSNALKHAFAGAKGHVRVGLHRDGRDVVLEVADDGVGFPPDVDFHDPKTLGLKLVGIFTEQLEGTLDLDRTKGTRFIIRFRAEGQS
jgi:two-component system, sensor histidine kinase PdtaS